MTPYELFYLSTVHKVYSDVLIIITSVVSLVKIYRSLVYNMQFNLLTLL